MNSATTENSSNHPIPTEKDVEESNIPLTPHFPHIELTEQNSFIEYGEYGTTESNQPVQSGSQKTKRRTSKCWDYFELDSVLGKVVCKCGNTQKYNSKSGNSGMNRHILACKYASSMRAEDDSGMNCNLVYFSLIHISMLCRFTSK